MMKKTKQLVLLLVLLQIAKYSVAQVPSTWTVNLASYQYQMTMTIKANESCIDLADTNNYIAAFVGSQCRGVIKTRTAVGGNKLGLLTIKSNVVSGETVKFQIYKAVSNTVLIVLDSTLFAQGSQQGNLTNPIIFYTNHPITDISITNDTILEHAVLATPIATISATDQDAGTTFSYSLTNGQSENTQFAIIGNQLVVNANYSYATDSIKVIEIKADDNAGCSYVETFTISIINENLPQIALNLSSPLIIDHQPAGSFMGEFSTIDPDINDSHIYSLVSGVGSADNAHFYIQNDTLYNMNILDYSTQSVYFIRARSIDLGGLFIENTFTLNISIENIVSSAIPLPSSNYISPNSDNKNDFWIIEDVYLYKDFALQIFDQFGHIIYTTPGNYNNEFDGKLNGKPLPTGNYYYVLKKENIIFKGNITIVN